MEVLDIFRMKASGAGCTDIETTVARDFEEYCQMKELVTYALGIGGFDIFGMWFTSKLTSRKFSMLIRDLPYIIEIHNGHIQYGSKKRDMDYIKKVIVSARRRDETGRGLNVLEECFLDIVPWLYHGVGHLNLDTININGVEEHLSFSESAASRCIWSSKDGDAIEDLKTYMKTGPIGRYIIDAKRMKRSIDDF